MQDEFWWGVIVTLIVGIPGAYAMAVLANMHTPRLVNFLESRKLLKRHKTRQQALQVFNRTKAFHDGKSRPQESERDDKWSFCLTAGTLCPANQEKQ
jgi:hypothetical protein